MFCIEWTIAACVNQAQRLDATVMQDRRRQLNSQTYKLICDKYDN